jgi:hypothetical protein
MVRVAADFTEMLIDLQVWDLKHLNQLITQLKELDPYRPLNGSISRAVTPRRWGRERGFSGRPLPVLRGYLAGLVAMTKDERRSGKFVVGLT